MLRIKETVSEKLRNSCQPRMRYLGPPASRLGLSSRTIARGRAPASRARRKRHSVIGAGAAGAERLYVGTPVVAVRTAETRPSFAKLSPRQRIALPGVRCFPASAA